jgi:hypothetical protein
VIATIVVIAPTVLPGIATRVVYTDQPPEPQKHPADEGCRESNPSFVSTFSNLHRRACRWPIAAAIKTGRCRLQCGAF